MLLAESNQKLGLQTTYTLIFKGDMYQKVCLNSLIKSLEVNRISIRPIITITNQEITLSSVCVLFVFFVLFYFPLVQFTQWSKTMATGHFSHS